MNKNITKIFFIIFIIFLASFSIVIAIDSNSEGWKLDPSESLSIDVNGDCRAIVNTGSNTYFIPTKTGTEWTSFINNSPGDVTVSNCQTPFSCGDNITDLDGNSYGTVQIGNQCWISENMRSTAGIQNWTGVSNSDWVQPNDSSCGPPNCDITGQPTTMTPAYSYVNNSSSNTATHGLFYNWWGAELACPPNWRLPSYTDIIELRMDSLSCEPYQYWDMDCSCMLWTGGTGEDLRDMCNSAPLKDSSSTYWEDLIPGCYPDWTLDGTNTLGFNGRGSGKRAWQEDSGCYTDDGGEAGGFNGFKKYSNNWLSDYNSEASAGNGYCTDTAWINASHPSWVECPWYFSFSGGDFSSNSPDYNKIGMSNYRPPWVGMTVRCIHD